MPSFRTAPVGMTKVPTFKSGWMAPQVPTRSRVWAPLCTSSSTAMEAEGPPMPVEVTVTGTPFNLPFQVQNSR